MTTVDGFYDATSGDRVYNSQNFSDFIRLTRADGYVLGYNNSMSVVEDSPVGMTVDVSTGAAFVQGRFIEVTALHTLTITAADVTNPRIDRVVVRADESAGVRTTSLVVLAGTPAASPVAPSLTRTSTIWEISLAQVAVAANETEITNAEITDERNEVSLCGVSTIVSSHRGIGARVRRSTNQAIPQTTATAINFDTENFDEFNFFDSGADTRLTIPHDGIYLLTANANIDTHTGITVDIRKNGTTVVARENSSITNATVVSMSTNQKAVKGDYFELVMTDTAAGGFTTVSTSDFAPVLSISLIGLTFS